MQLLRSPATISSITSSTLGRAGSTYIRAELMPSSNRPARARSKPDWVDVRALTARAEAIPCVITAMADEFGGPIPVGPFAIIGDDSIGHGIVETLSGHRSRAVLMQNHGVFTIGKDAKDAVKAAVMAEDVARTVHIAKQGGEVVRADEVLVTVEG